MVAATRDTTPGMRVPRTTEEDHAHVPFPPDARPVRKRTIPETKRIKPIQSNVLITSWTVVRFVGLSFRKITRTAIAKPPVLMLAVPMEGVRKVDEKYPAPGGMLGKCAADDGSHYTCDGPLLLTQSQEGYSSSNESRIFSPFFEGDYIADDDLCHAHYTSSSNSLNCPRNNQPHHR
jgi:hypothetical protein